MGWAGPLGTVAVLIPVVIFVHAAATWLRRREPLQGWVALAFAASLLGVVTELLLLAGRQPPPLLGALLLVGYLADPYLMLRLVGQLRPVPRWLPRAAAAGALALTGPLLLTPRPLPCWLALGYLAVFLGGELAAAGLLAGAARHRRGSARARLRAATLGTCCLALLPIAAAGGTISGRAPDDGFNRLAPADGVGTVIALAFLALMLTSSVAYLVAFLPPPWARRTWAAATAAAAGHKLLDAPATERPGEVWHRYAELVRDIARADVVVVLIPDGAGWMHEAARAGDPVAGPAPRVPRDRVAALLAGPQPRRLPAGTADGLLRDPAARAAAAGRPLHVTAMALPAPRLRGGALLVLHTWAGLFRDDDLHLLAGLAAQASVLAERGAVLAERDAALAGQRRLASELAGSVRALRAANRAKGEFLAAMSHELRTPLNAIIGFADLLVSDLDEAATHGQWSRHILHSGRQLLGLINALLDLSRAEAGRLDLDVAPLRLDRITGELLALLRPVLDRKRLRTDVHLPPITVTADARHLRRALENLLANAIRFTPADGRITVAARADAAGAYWSVTDTGVGIDAADRERVFEVFGRVGEPAGRAGGPGLGLALVRRVVRAHGGDVAVDSAPGRGSTFRVFLPRPGGALSSGSR
ncbi:sensor histidine kinase [Pilimelia anulata]|nr:HAMP domain-containing sensor histidine kinase [Pilimelia anulata]